MKTQIIIFYNQEEVAIRYWELIPRKDEYIRLYNKLDGWYLIKEVMWESLGEYPVVALCVELEEGIK